MNVQRHDQHGIKPLGPVKFREKWFSFSTRNKVGPIFCADKKAFLEGGAEKTFISSLLSAEILMNLNIKGVS